MRGRSVEPVVHEGIGHFYHVDMGFERLFVSGQSMTMMRWCIQHYEENSIALMYYIATSSKRLLVTCKYVDQKSYCPFLLINTEANIDV